MKFKFLIIFALLVGSLNHSIADEDNITFYTGTFDVIDKEGDDQTLY